MIPPKGESLPNVLIPGSGQSFAAPESSPSLGLRAVSQSNPTSAPAKYGPGPRRDERYKLIKIFQFSNRGSLLFFLLAIV